ncbi:hypothetical protein C0Q70_20994 [Pomacea canaliculata]|uniref:Uncharacterized protein n=1 Tax=Pomacea canaliculata TaxID=400727 RepID=A0A2T7NBA7_POMCA|nr:hypothetical protein C0Q70_20994 [Pomacea canaliculata]
MCVQTQVCEERFRHQVCHCADVSALGVSEVSPPVRDDGLPGFDGYAVPTTTEVVMVSNVVFLTTTATHGASITHPVSLTPQETKFRIVDKENDDDRGIIYFWVKIIKKTDDMPSSSHEDCPDTRKFFASFTKRQRGRDTGPNQKDKKGTPTLKRSGYSGLWKECACLRTVRDILVTPDVIALGKKKEKGKEKEKKGKEKEKKEKEKEKKEKGKEKEKKEKEKGKKGKEREKGNRKEALETDAHRSSSIY